MENEAKIGVIEYFWQTENPRRVIKKASWDTCTVHHEQLHMDAI